LDKGEPRLRVVGAYDYAALAHGGILLLGRDVLAAGVGVLLLGIGGSSIWRGSRAGIGRDVVRG
jgi:hypothetical protein